MATAFMHSTSPTKMDALMTPSFLSIVPSLDVTFSSSDIVCAGDANIHLVDAEGGSGQLFLEVQSPSNIPAVPVDQPLTDLLEATYIVQVVDSFGCTFPAGVGEEIVISEPQALVADVGVVLSLSCFNDCNGEVALEALGGTGNLDIAYLNTTTSQIFTTQLAFALGFMR